jgi:hypothetical protein
VTMEMHKRWMMCCTAAVHTTADACACNYCKKIRLFNCKKKQLGRGDGV